MTFSLGDSAVSLTWQIGSGRARIQKDKYSSGFGPIYIQYKTGSTKALCEADSWHDISSGDAFISLGWVKIKVGV